MNKKIPFDVCILFALVYHCKYRCQGFMDSTVSRKCHALVTYSAAQKIRIITFMLCYVESKI